MKKRIMLLVLPAVVLVGTLALFACAKKTPEPTPTDTTETTPATSAEPKFIKPGTLIVGSDCDYPPFISLDGEQPAGFEYELMQAITQEMGVELEYLPPQNFDSILASVDQGTKLDVGVSSFTITPERRELDDFCEPSFDSNQACVALKKAGYTKAADLNGKKVGAQSGTTGSAWVEENLPDATLVEYTQTSEALAALQAGKIEAAFFDEPVAAEQVATTYKDAVIVEAIPTGEQYGFAVAKTNPGLAEALNKALQATKDNGTYQKIFAEYFDFEPSL
jgi:polar amino acid transport system substrate-binding protein